MPYKCPEARRAANRKHYSQNPDYYRARNRRCREDNKAAIRAAKSVPCTDCGQAFPYYVMDLDHRPEETKLFELSQAGWQGRTRKMVAAEIAKCEAVCANCHRVRTFLRQGSEPSALSG